MKKIALPLFASLLLVSLSACDPGASHSTAPTPAPETTVTASSSTDGNELVSAALYGCPMHKEMIGSHGDQCPKCNYMEMIPVTWSLEGVDTVRVTTLPDYTPREH